MQGIQSSNDTRVGLARTICIRFMYGIFDRDLTKYMAIYGVYIYGSGQPNTRGSRKRGTTHLPAILQFTLHRELQATAGALKQLLAGQHLDGACTHHGACDHHLSHIVLGRCERALCVVILYVGGYEDVKM